VEAFAILSGYTTLKYSSKRQAVSSKWQAARTKHKTLFIWQNILILTKSTEPELKNLPLLLYYSMLNTASKQKN
jgi:hypothetical protein